MQYPSHPASGQGTDTENRPTATRATAVQEEQGGEMSRTRVGFADVEIDPAVVDDDALALAVRRCGALRGRITVAQAKLVAEIARRNSAAEAEETLKREQGITGRDAKESAKLADTLDKNPELGEAVASGEITPAHAKTIGDAETEHPGAAAELLPKAKSQGADGFSRHARDWRNRKDEQAGFDREAVQRKNRKFSMWVRDEDGMGIIHGEFDPPTFKKLQSVLGAFNERRYRAGNPNTGAGPCIEETSHRRLADAFEDVFDAASAGDDAPANAQLVVIADYDAIHHELINGRYTDGSPIPAGALRRLACGADILPMIFDGVSVPLDAGRSRRLPSATQRLAVIARDRGCRGENCFVPPEFCKPHHIDWWGRDHGETNVDRLVLVCEACHTGIHNGALTVIQRPDRSFTVTTLRRAAELTNSDDSSPTDRRRNEPAAAASETSHTCPNTRSATLFDQFDTAEAARATTARVRSMEWSGSPPAAVSGGRGA